MTSPQRATAPDGTVRRIVTIVNQRGLHARAAARFVKLAGQFQAAISVVKDDAVVSGSSIMGLMMLAAAPGSTVELRAIGPDATAAIEALAALIGAGFHEEE
jgi:phosphocarrier protein